MTYKNREIHIKETDDGFTGCASMTKDGIYSESDDVGPFATHAEAVAAVREQIDAHNEV